jgi:hypothetical protein
MNKKILILLIIIVLAILLFLASLIFRRACGIGGCYNYCEEDGDCTFYKDVGTCRNLDYQGSGEQLRSKLSFKDNRPIGTLLPVHCVCEPSGIIGQCRMQIIEE